MDRKIDNRISAQENISIENTGAGLGGNLEYGLIFYFLDRKKYRKLNTGLDWTIISASLATSRSWGEYAKLDPNVIALEGDFMTNGFGSGAFASKLGPVATFNPTGKLVLEARAQLRYATGFFTMGYKERDNAYYNLFKSHDSFGFGSSFGGTIRYGFIGITVDYEYAKVPLNFTIKEAGGAKTVTSQKVPLKNLFLKLNFSF